MDTSATNCTRTATNCAQTSATHANQTSSGEILAGVVAVGLILVGIVLYKYYKNTKYPSSGPVQDSGPHHPAKMEIRFAAVVKTEQVREMGHSPEKAAALFSNALMRWAGLERDWSDLTDQMKLTVLSDCPSGDGKDVIVTFTGSLLESDIPTNRLAMRNRLNDLAATGELRPSVLYDRPFIINSLRFGFYDV